MNTEQFRQSLRLKWLSYYKENREWLVRLGVWINFEGQRRPSSSFILATLSVLEPRLAQLMPLVVDLSSNPDRVVQALGLNFSPDEELQHAIATGEFHPSADAEPLKMLTASPFSPMPTSDPEDAVDAVDVYLQGRSPREIAAAQDAACFGVGGRSPSP